MPWYGCLTCDGPGPSAPPMIPQASWHISAGHCPDRFFTLQATNGHVDTMSIRFDSEVEICFFLWGVLHHSGFEAYRMARCSVENSR